MTKHTKYINLPTPGPEDRTTPWWKDFNLALAYKAETNEWPPRKHPTLGDWTNTTLTAVRNMNLNGISNRKSALLTEARVYELRRSGFPMDGKRPKDFSKPGKVSVLDRVIATLENGQSPASVDVAMLRNRRLSNDVESQLRSLGLRL